MGSSAAISMQYGSGEQDRMRQSVFLSFVLIAGISLVQNVLVYLELDGILWVPRGVTGIWLSVPIGWALADIIGIGYYLKKKR